MPPKPCWTHPLPEHGGGYFGIALGSDFCAELIKGLEQRFGDPSDPAALARVRVYVNSGRMLRRLQELFDSGPARLLPRLGLITELGEESAVGLLPASPKPVRTEFELARLIGELSRRLPDYVSHGARFELAAAVGSLVSEMDDEGVTLSDLGSLEPEAHAEHWQRNLAILQAAYDFLGSDPGTATSVEARRRMAVQAAIARWALTPPDHPIVVAGSTGSRGTTRLLINAVAGLPMGHVVLPGFDFNLSAEDWAQIASGPSVEDHPQGRYAALLQAANGDVVKGWIKAVNKPAPARTRLMSLALRPAPYTDTWQHDGADFVGLSEATHGLSLIEADNQAEEAATIAVCLRRAARDGKKAALVTPNRVLAREVAAALDRWSIVPDDSGGQPLHLSPPGRFLRLTACLATGPATTAELLAILKHPLAASAAGQRGAHLKQTRSFELYLRQNSIAHPKSTDLKTWKKGKNEAAARWADWLSASLLATPMPRGNHLAELAEAHRDLASALSNGPDNEGSGALWLKETGAAAHMVFQGLVDASDALGPLATYEYPQLLTRHLAQHSVYDPVTTHPDVLIWGTLEARVQSADMIILAGLNEGSWPPPLPADLWLNREMRAAAGLRLPERQIGLSAHDFQQAAAAPEVVLSRSKRSDGAETVPSRWVNRLTNLLGGMSAEGAKALVDMSDRGNVLIGLARQLDVGTPVAPATRPCPAPPVASRPRSLPVTQISQLVRDPYAVYARYILGLKPLNPIQPLPDFRLRGILFHAIMQQSVEAGWPGTADPATARADFAARAHSLLTDGVPWPAIAGHWHSRLVAQADALGAGERSRGKEGVPVLLEGTGRLPLAGLDFELSAKVDRIDRLQSGDYAIMDYKTGQVPSVKQVDAFDKQLVLEAALLERGGFDDIPDGSVVAALQYLSILKAQTYDIPIASEGDRRPDRAWDELHQLIRRYMAVETGYTARRAVAQMSYSGDYDHLSRHGEWDIDAVPHRERLGQI